jgi:molecular chaperone HtpG
MVQEKGNISIHTENIFPIIKKFLYSDHEIFLRELVANAIDATQKLKALAARGEFNGEIGDTKIKISIDKEAKTLTISDRGIGMTAEELKKYINQVAFSGASEFLDKYKDVQEAQQMIGHFGLGFYSAFMVADNVKIYTQSYKTDAEPALWVCDGSTEFEILPTVKEGRGSDIVLHLAADSEEFLDEYRIQGILNKYCRFLPYEIEFQGKVINETRPIWTKAPSELTNEDYIKFYKEMYPTAEDPLFWIHLNVDYPFTLTGILYFPKVKQDFVFQKNRIQLYSRQVFITDEVKDVVPEFLTLLHGIIDSPDIPLNVSRSYLQADGNVKKINSHITKKVADKLNELFNTDRKVYEEKWESIGLFVKYGMMTDDKFYDRATSFALLKNIKGEHFTFEEYKHKVSLDQTDKNNKLVYLYTTDLEKQDAYIQSANKRSYDVLRFDGVMIDSHFTGVLERKLENTLLRRVDSDTIDNIIDKGEVKEVVLSQEEQDNLTNLFKKISGKESIKVQSLPADEMPVIISLPEFMRRMKEMAVTQGMDYMKDLPAFLEVSINANHQLIHKLLKEADEVRKEQLALQAYDLALLSQNMLGGAALTRFINRSVEFVG